MSEQQYWRTLAILDHMRTSGLSELDLRLSDDASPNNIGTALGQTLVTCCDKAIGGATGRAIILRCAIELLNSITPIEG